MHIALLRALKLCNAVYTNPSAGAASRIIRQQIRLKIVEYSNVVGKTRHLSTGILLIISDLADYTC